MTKPFWIRALALANIAVYLLVGTPALIFGLSLVVTAFSMPQTVGLASFLFLIFSLPWIGLGVTYVLGLKAAFGALSLRSNSRWLIVGVSATAPLFLALVSRFQKWQAADFKIPPLFYPIILSVHLISIWMFTRPSVKEQLMVAERSRSPVRERMGALAYLTVILLWSCVSGVQRGMAIAQDQKNFDAFNEDRPTEEMTKLMDERNLKQIRRRGTVVVKVTYELPATRSDPEFVREAFIAPFGKGEMGFVVLSKDSDSERRDFVAEVTQAGYERLKRNPYTKSIEYGEVYRPMKKWDAQTMSESGSELFDDAHPVR